MADHRLSSSRVALVRHEPHAQAILLAASAFWFWSISEYVLALGAVVLGWLVVRTAHERSGALGDAWATEVGLRFEQPGETRLIPYASILAARHRFWSPGPSLFGRVELMIENEIQDGEQLAFAPPLGNRVDGRPAVLSELDARIEAAQLARIERAEALVTALPAVRSSVVGASTD